MSGQIQMVPVATIWRTWLAFAVLCIGMFMAILDIQIVATSLPDIQGALGLQKSEMSWIQTAYLIAEVIAIPLTGLLTRALSMRVLFMSALSVFTIASMGCAAASGFADLVAWRCLQGFAGGMLIPIVFTAVFVMFPERSQAAATTIAGVIAVLAPTIGPLIGGFITSTYSWPWLFLINVPTGVFAIACAIGVLPRIKGNVALLRQLDWAALAAIAVALASLELALKDAPEHGWRSQVVLMLFAMSGVLAAIFVVRSRISRSPIIDLRVFADRSFAIGCAMSFLLGMGLYGSVYLMPVFLAFVRGHDAWEIGQIMLVTGGAQLLTAPVAVALERRWDARVLTGFGFGLLAIGSALSSTQTIETDFNEMLLPQIVRGVAFMFCLLPPTRLALGALPLAQVADASAVFNLMRNLGGAIGLALIDTVLFGRSPGHAADLVARLTAGDTQAALAVGIPMADYLKGLAEGIDATTQKAVGAAVERASLAMAVDEAWLMLASMTVLAFVLVPFCRRRPAPGIGVHPSQG